MSGYDFSQHVELKKLNPDAALPEYQTGGAAGADVRSVENVVIAPGDTKIIKTGIAAKIPAGSVLLVCARSGLAAKTPYLVKNGIGIIDSDYRGEIGVIVHNLSDDDFLTINKGDRIAQFMLMPVSKASFAWVDELDETDRGEGGFGHTGTD